MFVTHPQGSNTEDRNGTEGDRPDIPDHFYPNGETKHAIFRVGAKGKYYSVGL